MSRPPPRVATALAWLPCALFSVFVCACGAASERRFPLREPLWVDRDQQAFAVPCSKETDKEGHPKCMPPEYISPLIWDAADNTVFLPVSDFFGVVRSGEARNVNSFDEVPNSSWFENRIGVRPVNRAELLAGACEEPSELDPDDPDGAWLVDMGKQNGATAGFRVRTPNGGKYLLKADVAAVAERASAAGVIGARLYNAVGFNTSCERIIYVRPALLKLKPGLQSTNNTGITRRFDQAALDQVLAAAAWRDGRVRLAASKWLPHPALGPFRYEGIRDDDPNDVIPHEDRRELRGARLLAAWLNHFDAREQNTMTTWVALGPNKTGSPGFIRHYYLDFSDSFGSEWDWDGISRRLGHSYYLDAGDVSIDFLTLGLLPRPWDRAQRTPGAALFGYYSERDFDPEHWKPGYPNPSFARMTERDAAWMARILARFTRDDVHALVGLGDLSQAAHRELLERVLLDRRQRILSRYFARLSPLSDVRISGRALCATDLSRRAGVYPEANYAYRASVDPGDAPAHPLPIRMQAPDSPCVELDAPRAGASPRYLVVRIHNGASEQPLRAHLYDLGPTRGYKLVGLVR